MTTSRRALLALLAGLLLALGAPPLELWQTFFVAVPAFALSIEGARVRVALLCGWLFGTAATLGAFYWIVGTVTRFTSLPLAVGLLAYVLMSAASGLTLGAAAALAGATRKALGLPLALGLAVIVVERFVPAVFPWQLASTLIAAPWIPQGADVLGISGLGGLLAGALAAAARPVGRRVGLAREPEVRAWRFAPWAGAALLVLAWTYGAIATARVRRAMQAAPVTRVALLQPAIAATIHPETLDRRAILTALQAQTAAALAQRPELVVWSEATYPHVLPHESVMDGAYGPPAFPRLGTPPIVLGAITSDEQNRVYNSAFLRDADGRLRGPVDKQVLVPFGEYIPIVGEIGFIRRAFRRAEGFARGAQAPVLTMPSGERLGLLNCFEDTMPTQGASLADIDLLVNITNDAWFGDGAGPWQHLMLARWRSIETRRELVRAVNTGITCHVDALGHIAEHAPQGPRGTLLIAARRLSLRPVAPWTIRFAPFAALAVLGAAWVLRLRAWLQARRARREQPVVDGTSAAS